LLQLLPVPGVVRMDSTQLDCHVQELLGGGAQGEVYRAELAGRPVALKWYHRVAATMQQRALLESLIRKGPPTNRFLWPLELATASRVPGFGYVMLLREARYRSLTDLMRRRVDPGFRALVTAGFELADSFLKLHSKGLCYRDISFGNLFLDPESGEILICDNDNVAVDGDTTVGVLGTPRFMAPEVVCGLAKPSTQTDLFSLAVLLFYLFMTHHPLEGKRETAIHSFDLPAMTELYGTHPVFIFDPVDASNRPLRGYHDNALDTWPIYPQFVRDLFTKAFTDGLRDAGHGRVREGEWRAAMVRLRDSIVYCQGCGAENFYERESVPAGAAACWSCGGQIRLPFRIRIGRAVVMLNHDTQLFPHHLDDQRAYDFTTPVAAVSRHPQQPGIWGLTNLGTTSWSFQTARDPSPIEVPPGRTAPLSSGNRINFGKVEGEIRE
jgi:eukaryotic-like serine/threonine-protein kinase